MRLAKKIIIRKEKRGCVWWLAVSFLACVAIALLAYGACIAAGVGLWFLARYCWRKLVVQAPGSKFVVKMSAVAPIVRQAGVGVLAALFSLTLMAGLTSAASAGSAKSTSQTTQTQQQEATATDDSAAQKKATTQEAGQGEPEEKTSETAVLSNLVVKFLDVGQGDASLIEFPDGKTMLIDTPTGESSTVTSALKADGRSGIDWLVATHPDADHIGGLDGVIGGTEVTSVWAPEVNSSTQTYTCFLEAVANKGLSIEPAYAGRRIAEGDGYAVDVLWPREGASYSEDNAYSAIIKVAYGENTFLFTGDAPVEAQEQAAAGHVDVLKVSHHGSASGLDTALASKLAPAIAVISYGKNSYGHPTQVVLDALVAAGAQVFGTYVNGTVTVTSDGHEVSVSAAREGSVVAASQDAGASSKGLSSGSSDDGSENGGEESGEQAGAEAESAAQGQATDDADAASEETVVITPGGEKYHRHGCRTIKKSKSLTELTKSEAQAQGYSACGVCHP